MFVKDAFACPGGTKRAAKLMLQSKHRGRARPLRTRLAADIGGTFTDIVAFDEQSGRMLLGKALSTPSHLVDGVAHGVGKAGTGYQFAKTFLHGSTIAINAILERHGAKAALLITEGFRDIYEIGRVNRPDSYNLYFKKHVPLIPRSMIFEIRERITASGDVLTSLDETGVAAICDKLEALGVEAVAILLLHSYRNIAHERRVKELVAERLPGIFVTASHELSQEYREFERCSTVVANAFIGPTVRDYVAGINLHLERSGFDGSFFIVQSTGGLYEARQAQSQCVRMLESGPAAGVVGARALCRELGLNDTIAFDMGGTTAKAGVIYRNEVLTTSTALIGGYNQALPVQIPMIDVFEVGMGGGSIASLAENNALSVGPKSAGAEPGPACYGRGGEQPTVTDANLVLGRLDPGNFLGGEMRLDTEAAERAIAHRIAEPLDMSMRAAADGILRIATTSMSYAVKSVSTQRGLDAAAFTLIAYGGAGPLHAAAIAHEIGMERVIVPRAPGHFCAFGMLFSDLRYDFVRTWPMRLADAGFAEIEAIYSDMFKSGRAALAQSKVKPSRIIVERSADMRYVGQEHAVTIELPPELFRRRDREGIKTRFDEVHQLRYGTHAPNEPAEIVSLRATVTGVLRKPTPERVAAGGRAPVSDARRGARPVFFSEHRRAEKTSVYAREALKSGNRIPGPALIEEHASTTLIPPGDRVEVDALGNLVIEIG
jgi:N-methylhydantoinase A